MSATELYERAGEFYQKRLQADLERAHLNSFVAIEPESGDFYLGRTDGDIACITARSVCYGEVGR